MREFSSLISSSILIDFHPLTNQSGTCGEIHRLDGKGRVEENSKDRVGFNEILWDEHGKVHELNLRSVSDWGYDLFIISWGVMTLGPGEVSVYWHRCY